MPLLWISPIKIFIPFTFTIPECLLWRKGSALSLATIFKYYPFLMLFMPVAQEMLWFLLPPSLWWFSLLLSYVEFLIFCSFIWWKTSSCFLRRSDFEIMWLKKLFYPSVSSVSLFGSYYVKFMPTYKWLLLKV